MEPLHNSLRRSVLFTLILFLTISVVNSELQLRAPNPASSCLNCCGSGSESDQPSSPDPPPIELQQIAAQEPPVDDAPTGDKSAGIGMEFEAGGLRFKSDKLAAKGDQGQTDACKGHPVRHKGENPGTNWGLTADVGGGPGLLNAEYILNGKLIKVGTGDLKKAAAAVQDALKKWNPSVKSDPNTVTVDKCNVDDWKIQLPANPGDVEKVAWEPQATAPMPLEGIQELISTVVGDKPPTSPLLNANGHVLVTKDFFQKVQVSQDNLKDDVLGFFSLVMSYIKADWEFGSSGSPKQLVNIMPRTDFTSIFTSQMKGKIPPDQLYDICKELACFKNDGNGVAIDTAWCSGTVKAHTYTNKFDTKVFKIDGKPGPSIKDWIQSISKRTVPDALSAAEKESIGALGPAMEYVMGTQRLVPIFEFRSLGPKTGLVYSQFADFADKVEQEVVRLHKKYAGTSKVRKRNSEGTMVSPVNRRANKCTPCPQGCPAT